MRLAAVLLALTLEEARAENGYELLQRALVAERVFGNLEEAIGLYERIVRDFPRDRGLSARALVRIGRCHEMTGFSSEARAVYQRVVREYGDELADAARARARLATLAPPAPGLLMARRVWAEPGVDAEGSPSPDESFLPYVDWETGDLALRDLETGRSRRLTRKGTWEQSQAYALNSVVSPDSREIAYTWYDGEGGFELKSIARDGSGDGVVLRAEGAGYIHPYEWTRNGEDILALLYQAPHQVDIVLVGARGGTVDVVETLEREPPFRMSLSPDGGHIVYDALQNGSSSERDVYVRGVASGAVTPLVDHPAHDAFPLWSPDGRYVVFISDRTGEPALWMVRVKDGEAEGAPELVKEDIGRSYPIGLTRRGSYYYALQTGIRDVYLATLDPVTGAVVSPPEPLSRRFIGSKGAAAFSRDGQFVAHVSEINSLPWYLGSRTITIRNLETGAERELRPSVDRLNRPQWSPDGSFLLARGLEASLYQIDVRNGEATILAEIEGFLQSPEWSPDGKTVFYRWNDLNTDYYIIARDLRTNVERRIYRVPPPAHLETLALSPDGEKLAFVLSEREKVAMILTLGSSGGASEPLVTLLAGERVSALAWSPDGAYVYFGRSRAGESLVTLSRVAAEGGNPEPLALSLESLSALSFHPDGRRIALAAGEYGEEIWALENFLPAPAPRR